MPTVTVLQGPRSVELKRDLITRITDAFVDALGVPADSVQSVDPGNTGRQLGSGWRPDCRQVAGGACSWQPWP